MWRRRAMPRPGHRFARERATVVVIGRTRSKLDEVAADAPAGTTIIPCVADISDEHRITQAVNAVADEHGRLDTLVNNAAVFPLGTVEHVGTATLRQAMEINVVGVFHTSRAALPHLRATRGSIVNIGSAAALGGDWGIAAYNTTKAAVANLTNAMALDHGGEGVRVNAVHPGLTATEMTEGLLQIDAVRAEFGRRMPLGRPGDPAEIAAVIAFLASPDASFVNGAHIRVDGGIGASNGNPRGG